MPRSLGALNSLRVYLFCFILVGRLKRLGAEARSAESRTRVLRCALMAPGRYTYVRVNPHLERMMANFG